MKAFESDGGTEFVNARVNNFLNLHGIHRRILSPFTPQQNGHAKHKHRHVSIIGLSMMFHDHAPVGLWFDAFAIAVYVINRLPFDLLDNKSLFELIYRTASNYVNFKHFGYCFFPYLRDYDTEKFASRSSPCIFFEIQQFR